MADILERLQSLRLKGRANAEMLQTSWGMAPSDVEAELAALGRDGLVEETKGFYKLSASGEAQRVSALEAERQGLDAGAVASLYDDFCGINGDFKQLVTDVQMGELDKEAAPQHLTELHGRFAPLVARIAEAIPRLGLYAGRFDAALASLVEGDPRYLASPMVDSYHTLWFELHEELIQASGRNRADEAAAGRGA